MLKRDDVISRLTEHADELRAFGIAGLFLYGSCARNEATEDSDVDLFMDRVEGTRMSLLDLARLQRHLEGILGTEVDIGTRTGLHPVLKADIEESAVKVF